MKEKSPLFCHGNFTIPWAGQVNFITIMNVTESLIGKVVKDIMVKITYIL